MKQIRTIKVAVAMSGGVDSSVAAALLKKQGYDVIGIFMRFWNDPSLEAAQNRCCSLAAFNDAKKVAQVLNIPIYTLNFKQSFKKYIVDNFIEQYRHGLTPNPCVRCNQFIKFGEFLKKAKALGCDFISTGHYVRTRPEIGNMKLEIGNRKAKLIKAVDKYKDQSYFLYRLNQDILKHCLFPIGNYKKSQVRVLAKKFKLPVFAKKDSQEVCFVPRGGLNKFLAQYLKLKSGNIIDLKGNILGHHQGLPLYTIGQRQGLNIGGRGPYYVVKLDIKKNNLVVTNDLKDLLSDIMLVKDVGWIRPVKLPAKLIVKIRYQHPGALAIISKNKNDLKVKFTKKQRAITAGQSAVFYQGDEIVGGGVICKK